MKYEVNECCDCAVPGYPCLGSSCSLRHVIKYKCDRCGADELTEDDVEHLYGEDVCLDCMEKEEDEDAI